MCSDMPSVGLCPHLCVQMCACALLVWMSCCTSLSLTLLVECVGVDSMHCRNAYMPDNGAIHSPAKHGGAYPTVWQGRTIHPVPRARALNGPGCPSWGS